MRDALAAALCENFDLGHGPSHERGIRPCGAGKEDADAIIAALAHRGVTLTREPGLDPCAALREAARAICFADLREGFQDGDDIVLRWPGNIADWQRLRAALASEDRP